MLNALIALVSSVVISSQTPTTPTTAISPTIINVPILMYHHVGNPNTWRTYSVDTKMFEWQMDYLKENGYTAVSVDQIVDALNGAALLPPKPVAITFDDGWQNQFANALPALISDSLKATFYLITNPLGKGTAYMTWDEVKTLRDKGMWIGSHTCSHPNLKWLSNQALAAELSDSQQTLKAQLGTAVTTIAYPGGGHNARVIKATQAAGYRAAVTVIGGYQQQGNKLFQLQRIGIYGVDTQERFIAKIDGTFFQRRWPRRVADAMS